MTKSTWIALTFLLVGLASCGEKTREEMIVGEWKWVSTTNLKSQQITSAEPGEKIFAIITKDSLIIKEKKANTSDKEHYAYKFTHKDSIQLSAKGKNLLTAHIKTLDKNNFELELDIFGPSRMTFEK